MYTLLQPIAESRRLHNLMQVSRVAYSFSPFVFMEFSRDFARIRILYCLSVTKVLEYFTVITHPLM